MSKHLHLEVVGKGYPLIMLHGWGWHSGIWQPLIPQLAENFQVFLLDLPGCGKSSLFTKSYEITAITASLLDRIPAQAAWLGWSLGGMIAWHIALHYPERVSKLITVASSPKFTSTENWPGVPSATLDKFSQLLAQDPQKTLQQFLELQLRGAPKNAELIDMLKQMMTITSPFMTLALDGGLQLLREFDLRHELTKLHCPSLHIFGSHDTLVPTSIVEKIQPLLPQGKCAVIKKSGHIPFLSQPEIFLQLVNNFLNTR